MRSEPNSRRKIATIPTVEIAPIRLTSALIWAS